MKKVWLAAGFMVAMDLFQLSAAEAVQNPPKAAAAPEAVDAAAPEKMNYTLRAHCVLSPTKGNTAEGIVTFTEVEGGVKIVAEVHHLTPGAHGFHIHEFGDCSAPDGSSAGGHFNPGHKKHGGPDAQERHAGDLGNLIADASGVAHYERIDTMIQLEGPDRIVGRSLIVHAQPDDFETQPTGNAGGRIACGVIEY